MGRQESFNQLPRVDRPAPGHPFQYRRQPGKQQEDERNGGENSIEGEGTCQERDIVLVGGLQRPPGKAAK